MTIANLPPALMPAFGRKKSARKLYSGYLKQIQRFVKAHGQFVPGARTLTITDPKTDKAIRSVTQQGDLFYTATHKNIGNPDQGADAYFRASTGELLNAYVPGMPTGKEGRDRHFPSPQVDKIVTRLLSRLSWELFHGNYQTAE